MSRPVRHWPGGIPSTIQPHPNGDLSLDEIKEEVKGWLLYVQVRKKTGCHAALEMMKNTSSASAALWLSDGHQHPRTIVILSTPVLLSDFLVPMGNDPVLSQRKACGTQPPR